MLLFPESFDFFGVSAPIAEMLVYLFGGAVLLALLVRIPLSYNLLNLRVRWKTTLLTASAFTLVIALLTVMLAFVNGMAQLTESSGQPGNVIILSEGSSDEAFSNLGFSDVGDLENQPGILREDGRPLVSRETYLVVNQPIADPPPGRPRRRFLQLRGLDDGEISGKVHGIQLHPGGTWFSDAGVRALENETGLSAVECVLGEGIARELALDEKTKLPNRERLEPGDTFQLNDRPWIVTGVMQSTGSTFDSEVWAKRSLIGPMFGKESYTSLVARTADHEAAIKLKDFFNNEYKKAAVAALIETEYFASLSETNKQFLYAIIFVTVVLAVGGIFGVMNTMFAAISQRTKDIGVLRVLGYSRRQILVSFLLESLTIALIGGIAGCVVGSFADGYTANSIVSGGQGGGKFVVLQLVVDANTIAAGIMLTMLMGYLGGLLPSLNAIRLTALEALR